MKIKLSKASDKFLRRLGSDKFAKQIAMKIRQLSVNDHTHDCKPLKGNLAGYIRADIGEFRIIYKVENDYLLIALIGKRNDDEVYKIMKNKI